MNRQGNRRRRSRFRVTGRFYVFLVVMIALLVLIIWGISGLVDRFTTHSYTGNITPIATSTPDAEQSAASPDMQEETPQTDASASPDATQGSEISSVDTFIEGLGTDANGGESDELPTLSEEEMVQVNDLSVTAGLDSSWRNILLLGQDSRTTGKSERTDTMVIASINANTGEIKLTSLMRDMYVEIPERGTQKINTANYYGGPELAMKTVNENFKLNISEYVIVNFVNFPYIIEKLGGVYVDITEAEMEGINELVQDSIKLGKKLKLDESALDNSLLDTYGPGTKLTGRQALSYSRLRSIDSDFQRTQRQRRVLEAILDRVKDITNPVELLSLGTDLIQYVDTNINLPSMVGLATTVFTHGISEMTELRLPVDGTYVGESRDGTWGIYDMDLAANATALHQFIYGTDAPA